MNKLLLSCKAFTDKMKSVYFIKCMNSDLISTKLVFITQ